MELGTLVSGEGVRVEVAWASRRICDVTEDSRTAVPGSLFIARRGTREDGRRYVAQAAAAGAVAILTDDAGLDVPAGVARVAVEDVEGAAGRIAERFHGSPSSRLALAGVTGTNGKTTIATLTWRVMNALGRRCGLIGTVEIDDGREVAPAMMTTPPATELSRTLATMVEHGCVAASMEVSSHALAQRRADALAFRVGVFTNLTGDHLDYHGTMEAYGQAKARLFEMLPADGFAIVNADDPWSERMAARTRARVVRCRMGAGGGDAWVRVVSATMAGMRLEVGGPWGVGEARVPMIGGHNAMNVLQAASACCALGAPLDGVLGAMSGARGPAGRLERVPGGSEGMPAVFVDYAHSDDALRNVLGAVSRALGARSGGERLWVVFGCGGDRDRTKRPRMGLAAAELADVVVVTSDNPRTERPGAIIDEVLAGVPANLRAKVTVIEERAAAIRHAVASASPGDVVVIAGKGHESEQILPDGRGGVVRRRFVDREVAAGALAARAGDSGGGSGGVSGGTRSDAA